MAQLRQRRANGRPPCCMYQGLAPYSLPPANADCWQEVPIGMWWLAFIVSVPREVEDHTRRHKAMLEPVEDLVDGRQRLELVIGLDFAVGGEGKRFGHIPARADERTADGDAVHHDIE